jgi:hypothetical protein
VHIAQRLALGHLHPPALAHAFVDDQEDELVAVLQPFRRLDHRFQALSRLPMRPMLPEYSSM